MRCEQVVKNLDAYRTGELNEARRRSVARHLAACRSCGVELAELLRIARLGSLAGLKAPQRLLDRVLKETGDRYGGVDTAIGKIWVGFNARGITMVSPAGPDPAGFEAAYLQRRGRAARAADVPGSYRRLVRLAAEGKHFGTAPVDLAGLSEFERRVLSLLPRIPRGEVRPYQWLAREAGRPGAVRAVGTVMARNPVPFVLPCHRVVPATGGVGRYAFGSRLKRELLVREGLPVDEQERMAETGVRYVGCKTTSIFCFPSCRQARRILPKNRDPLRNVRQAESAGYRPCMRCKPAAPAL